MIRKLTVKKAPGVIRKASPKAVAKVVRKGPIKTMGASAVLPSTPKVALAVVETKPQVASQVIFCDNGCCKHRKLDHCRAPEVRLVKTWMGSEKYYKLVCHTASDYVDPTKYEGSLQWVNQ